jgi:hypothetical protein
MLCSDDVHCTGECLKCFKKISIPWPAIGVAIGLIVLAVAVLIIKFNSNESVQSRNSTAVNMTTTPRRMSTAKGLTIDTQTTAATSTTAATTGSITSAHSSVVKIMITFAQIVGSIPTVFMIEYPPLFAKVLSSLNVFNLSFFKVRLT